MNAPVPSPNWTHYAEVVRVIDGDTFVARVDLGRYPTKMLAEPSLRVLDLWSPEKDEPGGIAAWDFAIGMLAGRRLVVQTRKPDPRDPYGRLVADVWLPDGRRFGDVMIEQGLGFRTKSELQVWLGQQA